MSVSDSLFKALNRRIPKAVFARLRVCANEK